MRLAESTGRKKLPKIRHLGTVAQLCRVISSQLRHVSTIGKNLVRQQYLPHKSSQCGELRPTSGWDQFGCFGHPSKFQRVSRLGFVTAWHSSVSQTLWRWTEGATYVRQGDHHVGHWSTFLVCFVLGLLNSIYRCIRWSNHNIRWHDTPGCQTGCTTGLTTGCIV